MKTIKAIVKFNHGPHRPHGQLEELSKRKSVKSVRSVVFILLAIALCLAGCPQLTDEALSGGGTPAAGEGTVTLRIDNGGARTVIPGAPSPAFYDLLFVDQANVHASVSENGVLAADIATKSVSLAAGVTWKVTVTGKDASNQPIATGISAGFSVTAGSSTAVTVSMGAMEWDNDTSKTGTFAWTITTTGVTGSFTTAITLAKQGDYGANPSLTQAASGTATVAAGMYDALVTVTKSNTTVAANREIVHIYQNQTSSLTWTVTDADFVAAVPLAGTVTVNNVPAGSTLDNTGVTVTFFSDSALTQPIGSASSVTGSASPWDWYGTIPVTALSTLSSGTIYFKVDAVLGGTPSGTVSLLTASETGITDIGRADISLPTLTINNDEIPTISSTNMGSDAAYRYGAELTVTASVTDTSGALTYQWYSSNTVGATSGGTALEDGNGSLTPGASSDGFYPDNDSGAGPYHYYVVVTNTTSGKSAAVAQNVTITARANDGYWATGGAVTYEGRNEIHTFTSTGSSTFLFYKQPPGVVSDGNNIWVLMVGGGGGGADGTYSNGGGGGEGGGVAVGQYAAMPSSVPLFVGGGGTANNPGGASWWGSIGSSASSGAGGNGVNGGSLYGEGNGGNGGTGSSNSTAGTDGKSPNELPNGEPFGGEKYGGGGGGGAGDYLATGSSAGGNGGGGNGGRSDNNGLPGTDGKGGGGGGGGSATSTTPGNGGKGGNGIIVVRIPIR